MALARLGGRDGNRLDVTKMRTMIRSFATALLAILVIASQGATPTASAQKTTGKPLELTWEELMPEGEEERILQLYEAYYATVGANGGAGAIAEGSAADSMPQIGTYNTVKALDKRLVRIPGYIVPFDFSSKETYREFLLVPYFGACIHTPPPPPNQIVYVSVKAGVRIKDIWAPVWIEGVLSTTRKENSLGNAAYSLELTRLQPYDQ
jgi:hypothetical protein